MSHLMNLYNMLIDPAHKSISLMYHLVDKPNLMMVGANRTENEVENEERLRAVDEVAARPTTPSTKRSEQLKSLRKSNPKLSGQLVVG